MSTEELIDSLLYEEESTTLDFKSEQYKFVKAQDWEKAELLKDIVAFANAWRRSDAYILIGVKELKGGKSLVEGISDDLDDAQLQQFIQSKINKPIHFSYLTTEVEGKKLALITIPVQSRPVFLKKDFSSLKANTVYVRRGSSTSIALPDEIASMGSSDNGEVKKSPKLKAFIVSGEHDEIQLDSIERSVILANIPGKDEFPKYGEPDYPTQFRQLAIRSSLLGGKNKGYYSEFAEYFRQIQSFFALKIGVKNDGNLVARDVRTVVDFQGLPEGSVIFHERHLPDRPKAETDFLHIRNLNRPPAVYDLSIKTIPEGYRANFDFGKLQSKDSLVCSEHLYLKIPHSCQISASVAIYSDDLEIPEKLNFMINVNAEAKSYSVSEIMELSE
jgi:hypothetical protein